MQLVQGALGPLENQRDEERGKIVFRMKSLPPPALGASGKGVGSQTPPCPRSMECPANPNQALPPKTKIPWKYQVDLPRGIRGVRMGVQDVPSVPSSVPTLGWRAGDGAWGGPGAVLVLGSAPVILWELCQGIHGSCASGSMGSLPTRSSPGSGLTSPHTNDAAHSRCHRAR